MLPGKEYPSSHPVLEEVYTNIFKKWGHNVIWIMRLAEFSTKVEVKDWNGTIVYVLPTLVKLNLKNLKNWLQQARNKFEIICRIIKDRRIDLFQVRNGEIDGLIGIYVKWRFGIPFIFQLSAPGPEFAIQSANLGLTTHHLLQILRGKLKKITQRLILKKADLVLPISESMKSDLMKHGIQKNKMMSFPPGFDLSLIRRNISGDEIRLRYKLGISPTLIYFGTIHRLRMLDFLIEVMQMVAQQIPTVKLLMVGGATTSDKASEEYIQELKALADRLGILENVIFTGRVPRREVYECIAASDIGLSPIPPLPIYLVSAPIKLVETIGMGKPVVANDIPEQKNIISASHCGICTKYDEQEFAHAIIHLLRNPEEAKEMGLRGQKYVEKHRSYDILARMVEDKYYKILDWTSYQKNLEKHV